LLGVDYQKLFDEGEHVNNEKEMKQFVVAKLFKRCKYDVYYRLQTELQDEKHERRHFEEKSQQLTKQCKKLQNECDRLKTELNKLNVQRKHSLYVILTPM
jgi:hypothetical protein